MSLSSERMAIANRAIRQTFEKSSIAWQAIPHWDTGDPGQVLVRNDVIPIQPPLGPGPLGGAPIRPDSQEALFQVTLAQAAAAAPDALLASVIPRTVQLASRFDGAVLGALRTPAITANTEPWYRKLAEEANKSATLKELVAARSVLEDQGYRAQSCLIASTEYFTDLNGFIAADLLTKELLTAPSVNSVFRASQLAGFMIMLGRRQEIAHGAGGSASAGEEPVDIAVCVPPSLEVIGENAAGQIEMAVRVRFATRVKDERGVVVFHT